ncbi:MAG: 2-C-methyl-D-erythritol 2,4-cyclodiphosphate synthase [Methylococcaceae bacterium]|nr:2-C-methyl-D-erythritol 2,4-cyclodiphosphate synthase [Methylococcaceae bacterium]MCI0732997.1 2-C-methyl-D-erythritol 2,4-cyclodiphosphate synthase [Methylococcaceae bacterium]
MRIGHGYDAHRFQNQGELILGGEKIDYEKGMLAHSDGDVVLHALCDALLGAAALGDLGKHFPDSDPQYKGIASRILVERVMAELSALGYRVANADLTIIAQEPRLAPYIPAMKANIARYLGISRDNVNVKATTTEKMGFEGRGEGISAHAVVLLESP